MAQMPLAVCGIFVMLLGFVASSGEDTNLAPCEQKIEDVKGVIKTAKSGTISNCTWLITVPAGNNIFLKFTTLELEFKYKYYSWPTEKETELQVWEGHNESSAWLGIYRGTKRAFSLQSSGRYLFIRLRVPPDTVLCNVQALFFASTVIEKPEIHFPGPAVRAMKDFWLKCSARGTPPIQITINQNGTQLVKGTGFAKVRIADEGEYRCTARNEAGTDSKEIIVSFPTNCDSECRGYGGYTGEEETRAVNNYGCWDSSSHNDIFRCAPTIATRIAIWSNEIRELPADSFKNMDSLQILDLRWNEIDQIPSDVFSDLKDLRVLYLEGNKIEDLPMGTFGPLSNLQILNLGSNRLQRLPKDIFKNLSTLQELNFSGNVIKELHNEIFMNLRSLLLLDMQSNAIESLYWGMFDNLEFLTYLDLGNNKIRSLPPGLFNRLTKLKKLNLGSNRLQPLPKDIFKNLSTLQQLNLEGNEIEDLPVGTFGALSNLQILYLGFNRLQSLPKDIFKNLSTLKELYLLANKIKILPTGIFHGQNLLKELDLQSNQLEKIGASFFRNLTSVKYLILRDNRLTEIPEGIGTMTSLLILDLSWNNITRIPVTPLNRLRKLKVLALYQNIIDSITNETFANLTELEFLLLNHNGLTKIPDEAFLNLKNLRLLMLSDNKIKDVGSKAFIVGNSYDTTIYMMRTALRSLDLDSLEGVDSATTKLNMGDGQIASMTLKNKIGSMLCKIQLGVGNSDKDYFELKLHVDERRSIHSQLWLQQLREVRVRYEDYNVWYSRDEVYTDRYMYILRQSLQQSGFANVTTTPTHVRYFPCPTGTFVNASTKHSSSCEDCPPGGYFSDSLAFVSKTGCSRCPNGTYVSLDNSPGKHALNCNACPQGTDTDSFAGSRACKCLDGFHRTHMFKGCQKCNKEGLKCENDCITLKPGYWWKWSNDSVKGLYETYTSNLLSSSPSVDSNRVQYNYSLPMPHECPRKESCLGGLNSKCEQGYEGPLCEVCSHGYYKHLQTCKECPTKAWMAGQLTITFVLLLLLVVVVVWTSIKKNKENRERALVDIILARLKIVIGFYQVTFGIVNAFAFIKWPDSLAAIAKYSKMLQLNVLQIAPIHCLFPQLKVDAFKSLFAILAMNAAAVAVAGTSYGIKRLLMIFRSGHLENDAEAKQISKTKELIYRNLFFFLFVTYLTTCSKTANVLSVTCRKICQDDNGEICPEYLKGDYTTECHDPRYKHLVSVAYFAIAYIVFLPLASYLFLWKQNRKVKASLNDSGQKQTFGKELAAGMRFLSENYTARSWYWELVETVRKVILTSGFILLGVESRAYVGLACVISGLYGIFFAYVRPVEDPFDNKLMLTSLAVTFVNLGIGAVSKIRKENVPASIDRYVDSVMFNILVIAANTLVIGLLIVQYSFRLYHFIQKWRKNPQWSMSCCLAMLLPLNDLPGEIQGMMGRNVLRQRIKSGRMAIPSVAGAVKETGAIAFQLEEDDTTKVAPDSMGGHDDSSHSPQIATYPTDPFITDFALSPLVVHYRSNRRETSV